MKKATFIQKRQGFVLILIFVMLFTSVNLTASAEGEEANPDKEYIYREYALEQSEDMYIFVDLETNEKTPLINMRLYITESHTFYFGQQLNNSIRYLTNEQDAYLYLKEFTRESAINERYSWNDAVVKTVTFKDDGSPDKIILYVRKDERKNKDPISSLEKNPDVNLWENLEIEYQGSKMLGGFFRLGILDTENISRLNKYRLVEHSDFYQQFYDMDDFESPYIVPQGYILDVVNGRVLRVSMADYDILQSWANLKTEIDRENEELSFLESIEKTIDDIDVTVFGILESLQTIVSGTFPFNFTLSVATLIVTKFGVSIIEVFWENLDSADLLFSNRTTKLLISFFWYFGLILWGIGFLCSIADEAKSLRSNGYLSDSLQDLILNYIKSFFALLLYSSLPIKLYAATSVIASNIANQRSNANVNILSLLLNSGVFDTFLTLIFFVVFIISLLKLMFSALKRAGVLLILIATGSLHMLSVAQGRWDAFWSWTRQVVGLCFTNFLQLVIAAASFDLAGNSLNTGEIEIFLLAVGLVLVAVEIPQIADRFGMDTSLRGNAGSFVQAALVVARKAVTKGA